MATILLLDDSCDLQDMFRVIFTMNNYSIFTVNDDGKFLAQIESSKPDLIIIDVLLFKNDGRVLCKEIKSKEETKNIPIILMSASPLNLDNYKEYFADDILEKPFSVNELLDKVNSLLNPSLTTIFIKDVPQNSN